MTQESFDSATLFTIVGTFAIGGVILVSLLAGNKLRLALSIVIGVIAWIILEPVVRKGAIPDLQPYSMLLCIGLGLLSGYVTTLCVKGLLDSGASILTSIRDETPGLLVPEKWAEAASAPPLTPRDHVKRWFVTISAATGAAVGNMLAFGLFWKALWDSFSVSNLLIAVLLVIVSIFLVGPLQSYIFDWGAGGDHPSSDPSKKISDIFVHGIDRRAAVRLCLVLLAYLQVYLLSASVATSVKQADMRLTYTLINAIVTPAIVSYYWSAALQLRVRSVAVATIGPVIVAGGIMYYGSALVATVSFIGIMELSKAGVGIILLPVLAMGVALLMAAVKCVLYSVAGGWVVDEFSKTKAVMGYMIGALALAGFAEIWLTIPLLWFQEIRPDQIRYWTFITALIGWYVGLWASGFPKLLTEIRSASPEVKPA